MSEGRVQFRSHDDVRSLFGTRDKNLRRLRDVLHIDVVLRGDELHLHGDQAQVALGTKVFSELKAVIERTGNLEDEDLERALGRTLISDPAAAEEVIDVFHKARKIRPMGTGQQGYIKAIREHDLVICSGPAGSGKTYLAVAMAVNALRLEQVRKIVLVRPAVEAGEHLGFLPGTLTEKIDPYLRPLFDALHDMLDQDAIPRLMQSGVIEVAPLAYMRGRTLNDSFIILDEAQNTTPEQMKMFLTRLGFGSKMVITGDVTQVDLPNGKNSGLATIRKILEGIDDISFMDLTAEDVVRHRLISDIVSAYESYESKAESDLKARQSQPRHLR